MDGCSDIMYYIKIVMPLSKAVTAVLELKIPGYFALAEEAKEQLC